MNQIQVNIAKPASIQRELNRFRRRGETCVVFQFCSVKYFGARGAGTGTEVTDGLTAFCLVFVPCRGVLCTNALSSVREIDFRDCDHQQTM